MEFCPNNLTIAREEASLSPERLGNSLLSPVSGQTIRNYESGVFCPDVNTLLHIASTLGRDPSFFFAEALNKFIHKPNASTQQPEEPADARQAATGG